MTYLTDEAAQQIEEIVEHLLVDHPTARHHKACVGALSIIRAARAQEQKPAHPDDEAVDRFAKAMKAKLAKKRAEGRGGWEDKSQCSAKFLNRLLNEHVGKGDPVDVGNLAMMLWNRDERTEAARAQADRSGEATDMVQVPIGYVIEDNNYTGSMIYANKGDEYFLPVYLYPIRTKDLTDDEILNVTVKVPYGDAYFIGVARAVIAKDREKNRV